MKDKNQGGEKVKVENIYELYFKDVYHFVLSLCANVAVAEDITQDTFLKAIKNIRSFDEKKRHQSLAFHHC